MNENHLRAITSSLLFAEKRLSELQDKLTRDDNRHQLYHYLNDLHTKHRETTLNSINEILYEINYTAQTLHLDPTEMSLRREAESVLSGVWVVLEGIKPESLKGYGTLSEADEQTMTKIYERFQNVLASHTYKLP